MNSELPRPSTRKHSRKAGFSLVEILIVIALIAILATVAISNLGTIFGGQQEKIAQQVVNQGMKLALTAYKLDIGSYPSTDEGLQALVAAPAGKESRWKGPYIEENSSAGSLGKCLSVCLSRFSQRKWCPQL